MKISIIAAMAKNRVIGRDNQMPWHLPADLKHFKAITMGKPILMGRKTFDSIGKALPGRKNIVLTSNKAAKYENTTIVNNIDEAMYEVAKDSNELMIIGGASIYELFLELADELFLTFIDLDVSGDTFFPDYANKGNWQEVAREEYRASEQNPYDYAFVQFKKVC